MAEFVRRNVAVMLNDGKPRTFHGVLRSGPLAVTPSLSTNPEGQGFYITHIATGYLASENFPTEEEALRVAELYLDGNEELWSFRTLAEGRKIKSQLMKIALASGGFPGRWTWPRAEEATE